MTVDESRARPLLDAIADEVEGLVDGAGVGTDYLIQASGDGVGEVGGLLFGIRASNEETGDDWADVIKAKERLATRLDQIGIEWEVNDGMTRRAWEDKVVRRSPPYLEIVTAELTEEHLSQWDLIKDTKG